MTTQPTWSASDDETNDLLTLVADATSPIGRDAPDLFLAACRRDAMAHDGLVSVNRVRVLMAEADVEPHRYSSFWSAFTGRGKPMVKADAWEPCEGSASGNDGRPYRLRRWIA
jgi:hypothetical protein